MKMSLILVFYFFFHPSIEPVMIEIRNLYELAPVNENAFSKLHKVLENAKPDNAVIKGYKGAGIMIGAKYVFSPLSKLSKFNRGKRIIEEAIAKDPNNIELRYLRLTVQVNLPKFLGYDDAVKIDKQLVLKNLEYLKDLDLKSRIIDYLLSSDICSKDEQNKLKLWKSK